MIASGESRTLELKKTTGELKDGMHSACAFLNTEGGWLIFGVAPKSLKIIGQEVTDKTQQEIAQALAGLEPAVDVRVAYADVPEHTDCQVIAIHLDGWGWGKRPHTFHGCPYYKIESTTKIMPRICTTSASEPICQKWMPEHKGHTRDYIRKITDKLQANGCLIRKGSTKGGKWIIVNKKLNDGK